MTWERPVNAPYLFLFNYALNSDVAFLTADHQIDVQLLQVDPLSFSQT